jgi:hypothetical protein
MARFARVVVVLLFVLLALAESGAAQTTELTYQGQLQSSSAPANGSFDFEFALFDSGGTQIGATLTRSGVGVANGIFSVNLDFGSSFPGATRFLEIRVRPAGGGAYTTLSPRQPLTSTPYSVKSLNSENAVNATNAVSATTATNATQLGGVAASQFVQTNDARLADARTPTAGSSNYIQNTTSPQAASNFNISGTGRANAFTAATQYNIGSNRVLSIPGSDNLFAGVGAGVLNTTGAGNVFLGADAGEANTTGSDNVFLGSNTGIANSVGHSNTLVGARVQLFGATATTWNSFFGTEAGFYNEQNMGSFFGYRAGYRNRGGFGNALFGAKAGLENQYGGDNSFFGYEAGMNSTGDSNSFFGEGAGTVNTTGSSNTALGRNADFSVGDLTYATAIGAGSVASNDNSVVLGRSADTVRIPGNLNTTGSTTVNGNFILGSGGTALFNSPITLSASGLGTAGSADLCRNASFQIALCSSSLRYKTNVERSQLGLNLVNRLQPVTFDWKDGGMHDLGLGAEDVAAIEPLLVTYNAKGEVEGVKYDRLGVVLINAVKEQQRQIEELQKDNARQKRINDNLLKLVCSKNKRADMCRDAEK